MSLVDVFKESKLGQAFAIAVPCIVVTWTVVLVLYVKPRNFSINEKNQKIKDLREEVRRLEQEVGRLKDDLRFYLEQNPPSGGSSILSPHLRKVFEEAELLNLPHEFYSDALKKLDILLSVWPDYVPAYLLKARIYLVENFRKPQKALDELEKGLSSALLNNICSFL